MAGGVLGGDKPKQQETVGRAYPEKKEDFADIFMQDAQLKQQTMASVKRAQEKERPMDEAVTKLNDALSGKNEESKKIEKELEDLSRYTDEEIKMAEELLFNGYTKHNYKLSKTVDATIYSTNAVEISIVNELMYEFTKKYQKSDGSVDVSQKELDHIHQLYLLAISFKGYNDKEIAEERIRSLELIKNACKKLSEFEIGGDLENYRKLMEEIKKSVKGRAAEIKKLPASVIDSISLKRYSFETLMYEIISKGDVLPKS
jgi:hypothetical protein